MKKLFPLLMLANSAFAGDYIIKWKDDVSQNKKDQVIKLMKKKRVSFETNRVINTKSSTVKKLLKTGAFEYIEKDKELIAPISKHNYGEVNNLMEMKSNSVGWLLDNTNTKKAWEVTQGNQDVIVAFCDSGLSRYAKEVTAGNVLKGWNFVGNNSNTSPYSSWRCGVNYHGSNVAAFISAQYNPESNTGGIAPGISLLPGIITDACGRTSTARIVRCIDWAAKNGAKVINVSMTGASSVSAKDAAKDAYDKGAIVVWSSGNQNQQLFGENTKELVVVGGTDRVNDRYLSGSYGSNYGEPVDVVAPGEGVHVPWGSHPRTNGTSYSAPIVAGALGLIISANPEASLDEVIDVLKETSQKVGDEFYVGAGLIDVNAAVRAIKKDTEIDLEEEIN